jgi:hypothetical protein
VVPFIAFFFCGRAGLTSPGSKQSSGRSKLVVTLVKCPDEQLREERGALNLLPCVDYIQVVELLVVVLPACAKFLKFVHFL